MTDPWCCYIWCAIDPINIYPLYVSIFLPAPWIRHGFGGFIQLQLHCSERLGDSQERRLQRNGPVGGVEVEEIPRGSGVPNMGIAWIKIRKWNHLWYHKTHRIHVCYIW